MSAIDGNTAEAAIRDALREVIAPASMTVDVTLVWDPPWSPAMMSDTARELLHWPAH